jgi:hypothetical protein
MFVLGSFFGAILFSGIIYSLVKKILKKSIPNKINLRRIAFGMSFIFMLFITTITVGTAKGIVMYVPALIVIFFIDKMSEKGSDPYAKDNRVSLLDKMKEEETDKNM